MRRKTIIGFCVLFLSLLMVPAKIVYAQEEYLHEEGFVGDYQLKGLYDSCEEYFYADDWDIKKAELTLLFTATTLVREEASDFTVVVNGEPVYSQKVPLTAGETQELTVTLPARLLRAGINSIRIESYIRTSEGEPCEDDISGAAWMVIRKDSYISIGYRQKTVCRNVADVYKQMTSIHGLENELSAVFLPEKPTEHELTAAAYLLSGISSNAVLEYNSMQLVTADMVSDGLYAYGAFIARYSSLPEDLRALLDENQRAAAEEDAVIAYVENAGIQLLLITGNDDTALVNACRLFGNKADMEQTKTSWRRVSGEEDVKAAVLQENNRKLSETGSYVSGPFRQTASFNIAMNSDNRIVADSEVTIHFRYAQNLDFDRSLITVYVGETPIGSKKLERDSANKDTITLSIPNNLNITGNFMLKVTFDLIMKDLLCDVGKQDMPWAYVTEDSTITLRTEEVEWLLFDYYPGPFVYKGRLNDVTMILPEHDTAEDMEAMRKILLTLGRYMTDNAGNIRVCRADNIGDLSNTNVISIGRFEDNPIAGQLNESLYFQFSPTGTTILSNEKMKIEPNYGAGLGTGQMLYSPYSSGGKALLIVSGVTGRGMLDAADYLGDVQKNWQIYGDGFVTDGDTVNCYRFGGDNSREVTLLAKLTQQKGVVALAVTGFCVLILMCTSLVFILRKHRNV